MAVEVIDSTNQVEFAATGKVPEKPSPEPKPDPKVEAKVDEPAAVAAEDTDLTDDEKAAKAVMGSKKWDQVIGRRHRAQKEAEEARREADSFAENQYRERIAAEKRADELEARLKALESKAQPVESEKEPKPEDFKTPEEYWNARIDYKAKQAVLADRQLREQEEQARIHEQLDAARMVRNAAFAKDHDDYDDVVAKMGDLDLQVPGYITEYIMKSDNSPAVMYHWGKNPEDLRAVLKLTPSMAMTAIGRLEAKLEKAAAKVEETAPDKPADVSRSRAPAPITPVATDGGNGSAHKELKDMDTKETIAYWAERDKHSRSTRQRH